MNTVALAVRPTSAWHPSAWVHELLERQRTLALFGLALLAGLLPLLVLHGLDDRSLRGVGVWVKPIKFFASSALFALTTAWLVGLLPRERRRDGLVRLLVVLLVATALFENGYITWQAALGEASHYNVGDRFHALMYQAMGAAALLLTFTQPMLAWQVARHGDPAIDPLFRRAVVLALALTFVMGAGAGMLLGAVQPPAGTGLPLLGWHATGDLRPAHFIGLHAQQMLPLAAAGLLRLAPGRARSGFAVVVAFHVLAWAVAMAFGLQGAQFRPPVLPPA